MEKNVEMKSHTSHTCVAWHFLKMIQIYLSLDSHTF